MSWHGLLILGTQLLAGADIPAEVAGSNRIEVAQIIIIGNTLTRENVIRHRLLFRSGERIDEDDLRIAEWNVGRTNRFRSVRVEVLDPEVKTSARAILVSVDQRRKTADHPLILWQQSVEDGADVLFGEEVGGFLVTYLSEVLDRQPSYLAQVATLWPEEWDVDRLARLLP